MPTLGHISHTLRNCFFPLFGGGGVRGNDGYSCERICHSNKLHQFSGNFLITIAEMFHSKWLHITLINCSHHPIMSFQLIFPQNGTPFGAKWKREKFKLLLSFITYQALVTQSDLSFIKQLLYLHREHDMSHGLVTNMLLV